MAPAPRPSTANSVTEADTDRPAKRLKQHRSIDFDEHLSQEGRLRLYPSLRKIVCQFAGSQDVIPMHGGLPPAHSFPVGSVQLKLANGQEVEIKDAQKIAIAQQYCTTAQGYPALHQWCESHMTSLHKPPGQHEVLLTNGSNHTFEIVCELLMDRGDFILCEEYTYPSVIESVMIPKGYKALGLDMDQDGILPHSLQQVIKQHAASGQKPPRVLYTVPTGQNPTGMVTTLERKKKIYEICSEHDIVILEDDPYYYLQYSLTGEAFGFEGLGETYLSMDVDGRVIRLDSFSKFMAPGMRLGWVTCHPDILQKICFALHASTIGPCSFTQVMMAEILAAWGHDGLVKHLKSMQVEYKKRAAVVHQSAEKHLAEYAEWTAPRAGMFLWLKLKQIPDCMQIFEDLKAANVVVVPAKNEDLAVGVARLGEVLKKVSHQQFRVQEEPENSLTTATTMY